MAADKPTQLPPPPPPPPPPEPQGGQADAHITPEPFFLVWLEGLPSYPRWSFWHEYGRPCASHPLFASAFVADRSFLVDRHDLKDPMAPSTYGVLAFSNLEAAKQCGMAVAQGPLVPDSQLPGPPARVTVRRRIPAPQAQLDALAAETQRQQDEKAGKLVARQLQQAEARRAAGARSESAASAVPPPPPPPAPASPPAHVEVEAPPPPLLPAAAQAEEEPPLPAPTPTPPLPSSPSSAPLPPEDDSFTSGFFFAQPKQQQQQQTSNAQPRSGSAQQQQPPRRQRDEAVPLERATPAPPQQAKQLPRAEEPQPRQVARVASNEAQQGKGLQAAGPAGGLAAGSAAAGARAAPRSAPVAGRGRGRGGALRKRPVPVATQEPAAAARQPPTVGQDPLGSPRSLGSPRGSSRSFSAAPGAAVDAAPAVGVTANENVRAKAREFLQQGLQMAAKELEEQGEAPAEGGWDPAAVAAAAEAALLQRYRSTADQYKATTRMLFMNLKDKGNPELRQQVLRGGIPPHELVHMDSKQLASRELRHKIQSIEQEFLKNAVLPPDIAAGVSTTAAVELKQQGLLGHQLTSPGFASTTLHGGSRPSTPEDLLRAASSAPEPSNILDGAALSRLGEQQAQPQRPLALPASPFDVTVRVPAAREPLTGARGAATAAAAAGGAGGPAWPLPEIEAMPAYQLPPSPAHSGGGYASDHGVVPAVWDDAELGLPPAQHAQAATAARAAAAAAPTPAAALPSQQAVLQSSGGDGTPDLVIDEVVGPAQQAQQGAARAGTPDLDASEAALLVPAVRRQQQQQQQQRAGTPDLDADEAVLLAPAAQRQQQQQQPPERAGTPDMDANEAALLAPRLPGAGRAGTPDLDAEEAAGLLPPGRPPPQRSGTPDLSEEEAARLVPRGRPAQAAGGGTPDLSDGEAAALLPPRQQGGAGAPALAAAAAPGAAPPPVQQAAEQQQAAGQDAAAAERQRLRQLRWQELQRRSTGDAELEPLGQHAQQAQQAQREGTPDLDEEEAAALLPGGAAQAAALADRGLAPAGPALERQGTPDLGVSEHGSPAAGGTPDLSYADDDVQEAQQAQQAGPSKGAGGGSTRDEREQRRHERREGSRERRCKPSKERWRERSRSRSRDGDRRGRSAKASEGGDRSKRKSRGSSAGTGERGGRRERSPEERSGRDKRRRSSGGADSEGGHKDWVRRRGGSEEHKRRRSGSHRERSRSQSPRAGKRRSPNGGKGRASSRRTRSRSRERRRGSGAGSDGKRGSARGATPPPPAREADGAQKQQQSATLPPPEQAAAQPAASLQHSAAPSFEQQPRPLLAQQSFDLPLLGRTESGRPTARPADPRSWLAPGGAGQLAPIHEQPWPGQHAQHQAAAGAQAPAEGQADPLYLLQESPRDQGCFWKGQLDWPQGGGAASHLRLPAVARCWTAPQPDVDPPKLPPRLTVTATMPGPQLMPFLLSLSIQSCKVCWFLLSPEVAATQLLSSPDLQGNKVGICQVRLDGQELADEQQWWQGGQENRGWVLHVMRPNSEVNFFAGVHPDDVAAAGPGALLVLALPAWHGFLYNSALRFTQQRPNCAVRMLGPPLLHSLPLHLVARHRLAASMWQFERHREPLMRQGLLLKARRTPADGEALRALYGGLRQAERMLALQLGNAEMLLMPHHDGKHLQAALWSPDAGPDADRSVFDPWTQRLKLPAQAIHT